MKPFITWRQRPTDYKVEMWEEVALLHSLYFINTTFQHGTVQYRCFKTNIFTVDITQSFTQPHLHFVRFETKKITLIIREREPVLLTGQKTYIYRHHLKIIIQTKLLRIIFAIDYIIETPTATEDGNTVLSILSTSYQLPAMLVVLTFIWLSLCFSLLL